MSSEENYQFKFRLEILLEETRGEIKLFQDVPQPMEPARGYFLNLARKKKTLLEVLLNWKVSLEEVFPIGRIVKIKGFKNKPELNSKIGVITQFNVSTERCLVKLEQGLGLFEFEPVNLFKLPEDWESRYQQVIEYLQEYNSQIISYLQSRDKIIEKLKIPGIPPISEKENLQAKYETINIQLEKLQKVDTHSNSLEMNKKFLFNLEKHTRFCYLLMSRKEFLEKKTQTETSSVENEITVENEIMKQIEKLELGNLIVSYPSYNRCVTVNNMKVIHQLLKEKDYSYLDRDTIQEIPTTQMEDSEINDKLLNNTKKDILIKGNLKPESLVCIQKCILSWYIKFKFRYLRKELGHHIKKAVLEIKSLKMLITSNSEPPIIEQKTLDSELTNVEQTLSALEKSIAKGIIEIHEKKHSLLITFLKKILGEDTSESKLLSLNDDDWFLELIEFRKKFLQEFNFPVIGMNQPNKNLSLKKKIQETKDKLVSLNRDDSNNPRILLEIAIMEKKLFYYQEKKKLNIKKQILSQQNVQKWANVNEDNLSYQQTVVRAFDCLEIEDLQISNEAFQINLAQTYIQKKETLLNLIIEKNTNSLLVEVEKVSSKKSRKKKTKNNKEKKRRNNETSLNINNPREDVNSIKIDFTKYEKIAFTRWIQYSNLIKAIITIQSLFRKNIYHYQYQKIRLKIIGFQSRVRKRLHWLKIKQPQSFSSEKTKYLNAKQRRQFRRQQRRVLALESEVDDFFRSRYHKELEKLHSGQMDTTPTLGIRVPYEIQSRNCDGIPEGFIPQNNF